MKHKTLPHAHGFAAGIPSRDAKNRLNFEDFPIFRPNLTPEEILRGGAFGGSYFRPIASAITGLVHVDAWKELPASWLKNVPANKYCSLKYDAGVNKYGVKCGQDLINWEDSDWIRPQDPYGWFQWYCFFFLGRRSPDDSRQISRWSKCCGVKGRWKQNLIAKVAASGKAFDDPEVSPVVRQTLFHWGYELSVDDCKAFVKKLEKGSSVPYIAGGKVEIKGNGDLRDKKGGSQKRKRGSEG